MACVCGHAIEEHDGDHPAPNGTCTVIEVDGQTETPCECLGYEEDDDDEDDDYLEDVDDLDDDDYE